MARGSESGSSVQKPKTTIVEIQFVYTDGKEGEQQENMLLDGKFCTKQEVFPSILPKS